MNEQNKKQINKMGKLNLFKKLMRERTSVSCGSRPWTTRFHRAMTVALLALTTLGVKATDYVFVYDGNNYLSNNSGTIANSTSFVPNTCIWTCDNNSLDNSTSRALHSYSSSTTYLRGTTPNGESPSTGNSQENWRMNESRLYYRSGGTAYYLYYRGGSWRTSSGTSTNENDNTSYARVRNNGNIRTDYRATVYAVTTEDVPAGLSDFSISGVDAISSNGNYTYTHTNSRRNEACTSFTFNNTTYYSTNNAQAASTTQPVTTVTNGYAWSLEDNAYATLLNEETGEIKVNSLPDGAVTLTLTCSVTVDGKTKTATKQILLTNADKIATGRYVIYTGSNYLSDATAGTTDFNPSTCLWTGSNGNKWHNDNSNYLRLQYSSWNSRYTFSISNQTNGSNWSLTGTESGTTGMKLDDDSYSRYIRYNSGWGQTDDGTASSTDVVFAVTELQYNGSDVGVTTPTISAEVNADKTGIQFSHTNVEGTYKAGYTNYVFYNGANHYWWNGRLQTAKPEEISDWSHAQYEWSITNGGNYATIDATGVLKTKGIAATTGQSVTVTLTTTEASSGYRSTQTYNVEIRDHDVNNVTASIGNVNVIHAVNGQITLNGSLSGNYNPAYTTYTFGGNTHNLYNGKDLATAPGFNGTTGCTYAWSLSGEGAANATLSSTTAAAPTLTYTTDAGHDAVVTVNLTLTHPDYPAFSATATYPVTLYTSMLSAPAIAFNQGANQVALTSTISECEIYYTTDGSDPRTSGTKYTAPFALTTSPTTVKASCKRGDYWSEVTEGTYRLPLATPAISFSADGEVTIALADAPAGTIYRYTTDGSEPTASSALYDDAAKPTVENFVKVLAIALNDDYDPSDPGQNIYTFPSGVSDDGNTIVINDYEDHNWSYYKGLDYTLGDGTTYKKKYLYSIYSPNPRNVKITYRGYNTAEGKIILGSNTVGTSTLNTGTTPHVSPADGEGQNTFVYYKTLEKFVIGFFDQDKTGDDYDGTPAYPNDESQWYPYTVISNPFSVRPSTGSGDSKVYYGFAGWKILDGGEYIQGHADNDVLALDEIIHFTFDDDETYAPNCTSAEIVLEATWAVAKVKTDGLSNVGGTRYAPSFDGGTYETNFWVMPTVSNNFNVNSPCTIIGMNPDGTGDNSATRTISNNLTVNTSGSTPATNTVKVEWIRHGDVTFNANGNNLTLGRGITSSSRQGTIYGCNANKTCVNIVKVESGNYSTITPLGNDISEGTDVNTYFIFGCDYDKALADYSSTTNAYNTKLQASGLSWSGMGRANKSHGALYIRTLFKSGTFNSEYYAHRAQTQGQRFITIEGGYFKNNITCGSEVDYNQNNARALTLRIRGNAKVDGRIAGGSTSRNCSGNRCIVLTGGKVAGWIAAGSNSNSTTGGVTEGKSFVYIGGNAEVNSNNSSTPIGNSSGGAVYGAGCGIANTSDSGQMTQGSNVVLADEAYVERGIYGGGAMGRLPAGQTANMFVLGGHIGTGQGVITDGGSNKQVPQSGVFGGACNVGGGYSNIYMNGGLVEGGVFGGSNINGTMANDVNIQIVGGKVGTSAVPANVHGGGYGSSTNVTGAVTVTLGESGATEGATIYGGTYGGSALGTISSTSTININAGTFKGGIYGGGLGNETTSANVAGKSTVNMNGGLAEGGIYGGGNINSTVGGNVEMHIDGGQIGLDADHTANVHGGGYGSKTVVAGNVDVTLGVATEDETATGATIYGNVYGGSALGKVNGSGNGTSINTGAHTNVTMNLGSVNGNIFGGGMGELSGTGRLATAVAGEGVVNGQINVTINGTDATIVTDDVKDYAVDGVFGGCDMVAYAGTPVVEINNCATSIDYVYGGGNAAAVSGTDVTINGGDINWAFGGGNGEDEAKPGADVNGDVSLTITGGTVNNIFGGSNTLGNITGTCNVIVDEGEEGPDHCSIAVGELYGGGNKAELYVAPNLDIRCLRGRLDAIYGGAKAADVHSDINLVIKSGEYGKVFGGNNQSGTIYGSIKVTVEETGCEPIVIGELYGCGNKAAYDKANDPDDPQDPQVNIISCTSIGTVYGGGLGETAVVTGNPVVSIQQEVGDHATAVDADGDGEADNKTDAIGVIGDVFGGGNAAKVVGSTKVKIGTDLEVTGADGAIYKDGADKAIPASANIQGNVYGGGNKAEVTGNTQVIVGPAKN